MNNKILYKIIYESKLFTNNDEITITPFKNAEDGNDYSVWKVSSHDFKCVMKKSNIKELFIYKTYLKDVNCVPRLLSYVESNEDIYLFIEYINGQSKIKLSRDDLISIVDAIILFQDRYWGAVESDGGFTFEASLNSRLNRGKFLFDSELEKWYYEFLVCYKSTPRTLCHDDLLPFNAIITNEFCKAVIIDWEYAGIFPYPTSIVRLIAHGQDNDEAFFFIKDEDKEYAITYYFDNFIKIRGISYEEYRKTVDLFLLYEYCEWIMLGNKYSTADMNRFEAYKKKAEKHIKERLEKY